ncbi:MAG: DNA primase [Deltaproteobacteria bacterium]|nr:DNA primase [Deltaproteobacteria bacterium]
MISQATIEEIKERANLVDLVGESVNLKRNGANYTGLCPFHSEKSPSFHIRDNGRFYHCFGCGVSGTAITYIMESRGLSFPDAIEELAARYGIEVKKEGGVAPREDAPHKDVFWQINKSALEFYRSQLQSAEPSVKEYLTSRRLSGKALSEFAVGFAPKQWGAFCEYAKKQGFEEEMLLQSGLVRRSPRGDLYDTFRARVIFPILVEGRKVAGFGGRIVPGLLDEASLKTSPKYLNSPETAVYQKNKILYGMPQALESIRRKKELYLVEGYMDVIGLWQAGVTNTVATCGTATSENHVKRLQHLVERVVVLFDGDVAGRSAAARCFGVFLNSGIDIAALFLPEDEDPDTIALQHGSKTDEYLASLEKIPLIDCYIESLLQKSGWKDVKELGAAAKGKLAEEVAAALSKVRNSIEQSELIERAAMKLMVEPDLFSALIKKTDGVPPSDRTPKEVPSRNSGAASLRISVDELPKLDRELLQAVMVDKERLAGQFLRDSDICEGVHPATLRFIEGLHGIVSNDSVSDASKREGVKALLKDFGDSWLRLWKEAYLMLNDAGVDFARSVEQNRSFLKKSKLKQAITEIDRRVALAGSDQERAELVHEKVLLKRRLEQV